MIASPFTLVTSTKLQYFPYKCVNRIITTNINVNKWKPEVSNLCAFCTYRKETIEHLFWECNHVRGVWTALEKWLTRKLNEKLLSHTKTCR